MSCCLPDDRPQSITVTAYPRAGAKPAPTVTPTGRNRQTERLLGPRGFISKQNEFQMQMSRASPQKFVFRSCPGPPAPTGSSPTGQLKPTGSVLKTQLPRRPRPPADLPSEAPPPTLSRGGLGARAPHPSLRGPAPRAAGRGASVGRRGLRFLTWALQGDCGNRCLLTVQENKSGSLHAAVSRSQTGPALCGTRETTGLVPGRVRRLTGVRRRGCGLWVLAGSQPPRDSGREHGTGPPGSGTFIPSQQGNSFPTATHASRPPAAQGPRVPRRQV